jgi:hypothetical protein
MKARSRALFSMAMWTALLATGAAQLELKIGPAPRKDLMIQAPAAEGAIAPQLRAAGQVIIGNRVIVNGGNVFLGGEDGGEPAPAEPDPAGPQVLEFAHGQRFHGTLEALDRTRGEILWRRPDSSAPLLIPLEQISRWNSDTKPATEVRPAATVKFTGGDWLIADVTSIQGDKVQLQLLDGTRLNTSRAHIEWLYFSKTTAAETYDGPTSLAGWTSGGSWSYRDGALRATTPSPISRMFRALPDQVEYRLLVDQGEIANAFTVSLHSPTAATRGLNRGLIQLMLRASSLNLLASINGNFQSVQVELPKLPGAERGKGPMLFRIFDDFTAGRLLVHINGRKVAEWKIDQGAAGKNGGGFQFQPTSWSGEKEQSIYSIRILPWDGREPGEADERSSDSVAVMGGELKTGKVTSWDGRTLKMSTAMGALTLPGEKIGLLRFQRPESPTEDEVPVAHVRLAGRGEFDAVKLDWRDGKFQVRTNFGGDLALKPEDIAEIGFDRMAGSASPAEDALVFKNGDRLRGTLEGADDGGKLRWRTSQTAAVVEFATTHISGAQFAPRVPGLPGGTVVRFRNGDWLGGVFVTLDREQLIIDTAEAGRLTAPRATVKALYFSTEGPPAVSDGASDHDVWERSLELNTGISARRRKLQAAGSPWSYFAGSYSLARPGNTEYNRVGGLHLGRLFETLATRADVSFTVTGRRAPPFCSVQLFTEANSPGYMVHLSSVGLSLYDMNPRPRGRGISQQQFPFGKEITPNAPERHLRFLAERNSGRLTILVDGIVIAQINPKLSDDPRKLGRGLMISPQSNLPCTFSNMWVGPWNGIVPGPNAAPEMMTLANGDEVQGSVELATPTMLKATSDVGPLDLPMERLTMVDLGGLPVERGVGTRLHLAGQGALTVTAWRIENETLVCQSPIAGELKLPLAFVQEIVFTAPILEKPAPSPR